MEVMRVSDTLSDVGDAAVTLVTGYGPEKLMPPLIAVGTTGEAVMEISPVDAELTVTPVPVAVPKGADGDDPFVRGYGTEILKSPLGNVPPVPNTEVDVIGVTAAGVGVGVANVIFGTENVYVDVPGSVESQLLGMGMIPGPEAEGLGYDVVVFKTG